MLLKFDEIYFVNNEAWVKFILCIKSLSYIYIVYKKPDMTSQRHWFHENKAAFALKIIKQSTFIF